MLKVSESDLNCFCDFCHTLALHLGPWFLFEFTDTDFFSHAFIFCLLTMSNIYTAPNENHERVNVRSATPVPATPVLPPSLFPLETPPWGLCTLFSWHFSTYNKTGHPSGQHRVAPHVSAASWPHSMGGGMAPGPSHPGPLPAFPV